MTTMTSRRALTSTYTTVIEIVYQNADALQFIARVLHLPNDDDNSRFYKKPQLTHDF